MARNKKSQKPQDDNSKPIGKKHDDNRSNSDKSQRSDFNRNESMGRDDSDEKMSSGNEEKIQIDDDPKGTKRKIPRMNL